MRRLSPEIKKVLQILVSYVRLNPSFMPGHAGGEQLNGVKLGMERTLEHGGKGMTDWVK